ncbi:pyridoxal 5'-phosphate synthase glutaminase subunit PdxT [Actinomycetospora endophytica]|uniref:Pyridoxal 5'-phosphate synthase subunit PdxT n=1 Tax=Actinomycetospora endophytica TaxID=2291215 RepID=A0ABS8PE93_9PSEU|nr:pyridoxal 5'-phosphate synthase glutaminase subunit PdxT [Actinomycetospora endophytica]MCD2196581.1 pyridoxal 5'-phosphate synthase glutaminase subunit PdxT [Actinomycetospora endophytica]
MTAVGPPVGVLALQGNVPEHLDALRACGADPRPVRRPAELAEVAGLVLPGGESTTLSKLLVAFDLLEPLRGRLSTGMPAFGSCAGMILLAREAIDARPDQHQLGALDIVVRRNAFGRQVQSFESDLSVTGIGGGPVRAVFIRAPWVESVGRGVDVIARVPSSIGGEASGKIVAVRQGPVMATAFHPEQTGDARLHDLFLRRVREYAA